MLLGDFYTIDAIDANESGAFTVYIRLNAEHNIFKGHFPGNPITPGVCMVQIIKEVVQQVTGVQLILRSASTIKFTAIINPEVNPVLRLQLETSQTSDGLVKVKNTSFFEETTALKLNCIFLQRS